MKVAVMAEDYLSTMLSSKELTSLEEAIVEEIFNTATSRTTKVMCTGVFFRPGMLIINCEDQETVAWLREAVNNLPAWKGAKLITKVGDEIPRGQNATLFIPRWKGKNFETLLTIIGSQNKGLSTSLWRVLQSKEEEKGTLLRVSIDAASAEEIGRTGNTIHYRLGKIAVQGLKRQQASVPARSSEPSAKPAEEVSHSPEMVEAMQTDSQPEVAEKIATEEQLLLEGEMEEQQLSVSEEEEQMLLEEEEEAQPLDESEELKFFAGDMDEENTHPVPKLQ